jgi:predicted RecA/RadA family phage recombinase
MATNTVYMWTRSRPLVCSDPTTPASGDPVLMGQIPGVALVDEDAAGETTVALDGAFELSVKGIDGSGNSAVAKGDAIYYVTGDTPKLSKKTAGVLFGYALAAVSSGATATIAVEVGKA